MPSKIVETNPQKVALESIRPELAAFTGVTVGNTHTCSQGDVLGAITATGLYRRRTRGIVGATAFSAANPNGSVDDGTKFKVGDVLTNSVGAAVGTILAIVGNNITLTANAANAVATGAAVLASDGSQVAKGIADLGCDGVGDTPVPACVGGYLVEALLLGLDSTAKTELGGASVASGIFKF